MKGGNLSLNKLKKLNCNGVTLKNFELKNSTTFRIGGKAKYYLEICTIENFIQVMLYLESRQVDYFIIGNGSNLLVSDSGYSGLVIKLKGDFARCEKMQDTVIECGSGVLLSQAYAFARDLGLGGLEDSAGIPATIGGAVVMNAGAYNFEMSKIVDYVVVYMNGKIMYLRNSECLFAYRSSIFQDKKCIVLRVGLNLELSDKESMQNRYLELLKIRKEKLPLSLGNAGCVFRRLESINVSKALDECGFKGLGVGGAVVSDKHANFIVNKGNATSSDVYELINKIKTEFYSRLGIKLSCEIKFLGEFNEINR